MTPTRFEPDILGRVPLTTEAMARGGPVEPLGAAGRIVSPFAYWLVRWPQRQQRAVLNAFEDWLLSQAEETRAAVLAVTPG